MHENLKAELAKPTQLQQRQDGPTEHMRGLKAFAIKLGLYNAADIKANIFNIFLYLIAIVFGIYYNLIADHLGFSDPNVLFYYVARGVILLIIATSFLWIGIIRNAILPLAAIIILTLVVWI